jgi:hypothetical protein
MKTTVELPDELYRRTKANPTLRGCGVEDLIEEGLRLVLGASDNAGPPPGLAVLMKGARGICDSGVPDLASNPEHLARFGRDAGDR